MRQVMWVLCLVSISFQLCYGQEKSIGIRGDSSAIVDAEAMVESMGGMQIWAQLKSVHFVHEWFPYHRVDSYVEHEILDLDGPRSWVDRKSEISHTVRAYSPEAKYWSIRDDKFAYASDEVFERSMARAPFNFYRLVRAVAVGDSEYEIRYGEGDIPQSRRLEFYGRDGVLRGWIILNARMEPIVKATTQYRYTLGTLRRFGNLRVPAWGVYDNGATRYEMISLTGDNQPLNDSLFLPPAEYRE
jgi:hypothetical protein